MFWHGKGVVQDKKEAEKFYRLAANKNHKGVKNTLKQLKIYL